MNPKELFEKCLKQSTDTVLLVNDEDVLRPTPDTEWDVRQLVAHMLYELSWVPDILGGKTVSEVGRKYDGDLLGDDISRAWQAAAARALSSVNDVDVNRTIHLTYGDFPAQHFIREQANDQLVHAWDLGTALGVRVVFDVAVAEDLYLTAVPRKQELAASGLFAAPVAVSESADIQTKLLALLGRLS
ncbi:MAG TPA: TIGR03086 family metal-binding protein [Candidatus Saccharimonadia bacterium]|nr:TIGR03086 family metal-binding protein [Candidatus Saccharimonadia bacterium]